MAKRNAYLVAASIAVILAVMAPALANVEVSDSWFSIASVIRHDEALNGADNALMIVKVKDKQIRDLASE